MCAGVKVSQRRGLCKQDSTGYVIEPRAIERRPEQRSLAKEQQRVA